MALILAERNGHTEIADLLTQFSLMERARALGSKPCNSSKVMLVGEGRVGKTALRNSMVFGIISRILTSITLFSAPRQT